MTVEVEGGGGGSLRFLYGGGGFGGFYETSFSANILHL